MTDWWDTRSTYNREREDIVMAGGPWPDAWCGHLTPIHEGIGNTMDQLDVTDLVTRVDVHTRISRLAELDVLPLYIMSGVTRDSLTSSIRYKFMIPQSMCRTGMFFDLTFGVDKDARHHVFGSSPKSRSIKNAYSKTAGMGACVEIRIPSEAGEASVRFAVFTHTEEGMWNFLPRFFAFLRAYMRDGYSPVRRIMSLVQTQMAGRVRYCILPD
jgi:hypothetical protein